MKTLIEMYKIYSPSEHEEELSLFVQNELKKIGIPFQVDEYNQIYNLIPDTVLLSAHLDQVPLKHAKNIEIKKYKVGTVIQGDGNLGADDKNGIWIILQLLKEFPNTSFIFSTCEETMLYNKIFPLLLDNKDIIKTLKCGLIFDRMSNSDVIVRGKSLRIDYCDKFFLKKIKKLIKKQLWYITEGSFSDGDYIAYFINCINISCGYYNAHTMEEFSVKEEIIESLNFGKTLLKEL